jgi:hypothetical protein
MKKPLEQKRVSHHAERGCILFGGYIDRLRKICRCGNAAPESVSI